MKKWNIIFLLIGILSLINLPGAESPRRLTKFNDFWSFKNYGILTEQQLSELAAEVPKINFNDKNWRKLTLPHDWAIEQTFSKDLPNRTGKLPWQGVGVYRKSFKLKHAERSKRYFIHFDGAMSHAQVWLNGKYLGKWPYGYNSFRMELTKELNFDGENQLCVLLNNPANSSRWYPGGGIYRKVYLVKTSKVAISHDGVFISTKSCNQERAELSISAEVENRTDSDQAIYIHHRIKYKSKTIREFKSQTKTLDAGTKGDFQGDILVNQAHLWSIEAPNMYQIQSDVYVDGELVDSLKNDFGIRSIKFDAQKGFFLNDKRVKLKGVCLHHDLGPLGAAVDRGAIERRFKLLKEMGCNAIRVAHNPMCPDFMDLCDRMGFVVVNELFDGWAKSKTENDYGKHFFEWYKKDIRNFVRRDRNHPSVIMWSSGNEVRDGYFGNKKLFSHSKMLAAEFKKHDPTRPVTVGCDNIWFGFGGFQKTVDIFGYNYKPHKYKEFHDKNPTIPIMGSETASTVSSRGEYFFPVSDDKSLGYDPKTFHMSSYDLYAPEWASAPDLEFAAQDKYDFVMGEFVWTGFDYLGEPTPFNNDPSILSNLKDPKAKKRLEEKMKRMGGAAPSKSSYFGIMDLCGFKKDRFYLYQAKWRPDFPMAHILPHWNWPERLGEITPVHVYSSGDEAELFLNGKSLGIRKKQKYEYRFRWDDVIYQAGELKVIVKKSGQFWAKASLKTSQRPSSINLSLDDPKIKRGELNFITAKLVDENGVLVPRDDSEVEFSVEGPAEIVAVGNGDPTSHEANKSNKRKFFNGLCQVIIRSTAAGLIKVSAKSKELKINLIEFKSE